MDALVWTLNGPQQISGLLSSLFGLPTGWPLFNVEHEIIYARNESGPNDEHIRHWRDSYERSSGGKLRKINSQLYKVSFNDVRAAINQRQGLEGPATSSLTASRHLKRPVYFKDVSEVHANRDAIWSGPTVLPVYRLLYWLRPMSYQDLTYNYTTCAHRPLISYLRTHEHMHAVIIFSNMVYKCTILHHDKHVTALLHLYLQLIKSKLQPVHGGMSNNVRSCMWKLDYSVSFTMRR